MTKLHALLAASIALVVPLAHAKDWRDCIHTLLQAIEESGAAQRAGKQ